MLTDPDDPPTVRSPDSGDDHLIALAAMSRAVIVSADRHLLDLEGALPVFSPTAFLALLAD
jgi:predicted nucleic acid-binding protein